MSIREFAQKFIAAHEQAIITGNCDELEKLEDPGIVHHITPSGGDVVGWEAHRQHILELRQSLSGINVECEVLFSEGNLFAVLYKVKGIFAGEIPGMPPSTGKEITADTLSLLHVKNGKVCEVWAHGTTTGLG